MSLSSWLGPIFIASTSGEAFAAVRENLHVAFGLVRPCTPPFGPGPGDRRPTFDAQRPALTTDALKPASTRTTVPNRGEQRRMRPNTLTKA